MAIINIFSLLNFSILLYQKSQNLFSVSYVLWDFDTKRFLLFFSVGLNPQNYYDEYYSK